MATWNESEYVRRAQEIATKHVHGKTALNDLTEKTARDENLNPEEIRTLGRLANVATFQEYFKVKTASKDSDRMVEFEVCDPEAVIRRIVQEAQVPAPESATVLNDKLACELPDMMKEKRLGRKFDEITKTASEATERAPRRDMVVLNLQKLAADFEVEKVIEANRWEGQVSHLAKRFKKAAGYGPDYDAFEKDAMAEFGQECFPELMALRQDLRRAPVPTIAEEKLAQLQERHVTEETQELALLKTAMESRVRYVKLGRGLEWIAKNMPVL